MTKMLPEIKLVSMLDISAGCTTYAGADERGPDPVEVGNEEDGNAIRVAFNGSPKRRYISSSDQSAVFDS